MVLYLFEIINLEYCWACCYRDLHTGFNNCNIEKGSDIFLCFTGSVTILRRM